MARRRLPIVLLDEVAGLLHVVYSAAPDDDIVMRESALAPIAFGSDPTRS